MSVAAVSPELFGSNQWSDAVLNALPVAAYVCDAEGFIERFNPRAAQIWGRSPRVGKGGDKFCGSHRAYRLDGRPMEHADCHMALVLKSGVPLRDQDVIIERATGERIATVVNIEPLRDQIGAICGAVNCFTDVTERKHLEDQLRQSREELEDFFDNGAVALHSVGPDGKILRVNQAELDLLGYRHDEYIGRHVAEFHADQEIIQDILSRLTCGERLDKFPARLRTKDGSIRHVLITSSVYFRDKQFVHTRCFTIDVTEQQQAEAGRREGERRWRELLEALPAAVYTTDTQGRITFYNEAAEQLWGTRPALGESQWCGSWRLYWPDGTPLPHDQCPMATAVREDRPIRNVEAVAERPDGTRIPFMPYPTPLHDASGTLVGAVNMLIDLSHLKQAAERQQLLINELNHRVKNTLATVQSIAYQTFRGKVDPDLQKWFTDRLMALAKTHDVLTRENWKGADLSDIAMQAVAFACDQKGRVTVSGPKLMLPPRTILPLAMGLHELCTNASKYGALSSPTGRVAIEWQLSALADRVQLRWIERDGPVVQPPASSGFGTRLLERGLAHQLRADVKLAYPPAGLVCDIEFPLSTANA
jgi:PAS domain S-box-containing protein